MVSAAARRCSLPPYFQPTPVPEQQQHVFSDVGGDRARTRCGLRSWALARSPGSATRRRPASAWSWNGDRFFFDFGPPAHILAAQVPLENINDIFFTHLHVDHYGELPYLFCFAPWAAGGLRSACTGPWAARRTKVSAT